MAWLLVGVFDFGAAEAGAGVAAALGLEALPTCGKQTTVQTTKLCKINGPSTRQIAFKDHLNVLTLARLQEEANLQ